MGTWLHPTLPLSPRTSSKACGYIIMRERNGSILLTYIFHGEFQDLIWNWLQGTHSHYPWTFSSPQWKKLTYLCTGPGLPIRNKREKEKSTCLTLCNNSSLHIDPPIHLAKHHGKNAGSTGLWMNWIMRPHSPG